LIERLDSLYSIITARWQSASEALEVINEAEALIERTEDRHWYTEPHRLRAVFLAAIGADKAQIEVSSMHTKAAGSSATVENSC
jgi:hypothetical protein